MSIYSYIEFTPRLDWQTAGTGENIMKDSMAGFIGMSIAFACFFAWLTHVIACISDGVWGLLIGGAVFFPIGIVHGFGIWMGVW